MRRLILIVALLTGSCGSQTRTCGPSNCSDGCCDESGECLAGSSLFECGAGGNKCVACAANLVCSAGECALFDGGQYDAAFPMDPDASFNMDAGVYDASRPDSGVDAGRPDSGVPDAGRPDSGVPDAGRPDSGVPDAGFDAGRPDSGVDAGAGDAGADAGDGG